VALSEQQNIIRDANTEIDNLTQQKYQLEADVRKLEVEVGPIKYIAEMIYGDSADTNTLEKAVRIMIILLVVVFDPLAVLMLIAANWSLMQTKQSLPLPIPVPPKEPKQPNPPPPTPTKKPADHYVAQDGQWVARPHNFGKNNN
jgi:hypothetical protein